MTHSTARPTSLLALLALLGCAGQDAASGASGTDAASGASLSVSSVVPAATSARIAFSERYANGTLRCYWGPSSTFLKASDTTRTEIQRTTATSRGSAGSVTATGLSAGTAYSYLIQGYYPGKSTSTYNAWGSFTTTAAAARESSP